MPFQAPVVDSLSVRVVVDSRYERFLPKASHPMVQIEHIGRIPGRPDMTFAAEWGLSLLPQKVVYSNVGSRFTFGA